MKRLHLLVGGLAHGPWPDRPHLARLIARGRPADAGACTGTSAALAALFGIESRDLPAIMLAAEGGDAGSEAWFCADPVHLLAGMHSLSLLDSRQFQLPADEAAALVAALNRHFGDEMEFRAPHPTRWYARFRQTPKVAIPPLDQVAGSAITPEQIAGPDAREVQRISMEIQMLLHGHPVNESRDERHEATINSVWFWGGGGGRRAVANFDQVMADGFTAQALARAAGRPAMPLPDTLQPGRLPDGYTLAVLERPVPGQDAAWFEPVLRALQRGQLDAVELTLTGEPALRRVVGRWQARRFWRG